MLKALMVLLSCAALRPEAEAVPFSWTGSFDEPRWTQAWSLKKPGILFGEHNITIMKEDGAPGLSFLRIFLPKGSWSPKATAAAGLRHGGTEFLASVCAPPLDEAYLRYYVRFEPGFDFVKGGKLPGLYGGAANTGGKIPNGRDGFTTRFMWRSGGRGEVYAYLPDSDGYGSSIGRGSWHFKPGDWQMIEQRVRLNTPGKRDGEIQVWLDGQNVLWEKGLRFRDTDSLKIEGILFSTFFGGSDASWAAASDCHIDFASFALSARYIGKRAS